MKTKKMILAAIGGIFLMNGCAMKTALNDLWIIKPFMTAQPRIDNAQALYDLGRFYQGQERYGDAALALEKAVAMDQSFVEAHNRLAVSYAMLGRHEEAIRQLDMAIRIAPEASHLYDNLGYVQFLMGNYHEAKTALQKALDLDPENGRALNNLDLVYKQLGEDGNSSNAFAKAASPQPVGRGIEVQHPAPLIEMSHSEIVQVAPSVFELRLDTSLSSLAIRDYSPPPPRGRVEVSNGNGINGMARGVGLYLKHKGYSPARLTNQRSYDVLMTRIEYRSGFEEQARNLAGTLPQHVGLAPGNSMRRDINVRVVLGKDLAGRKQYFDQGVGQAGMPRV